MAELKHPIQEAERYLENARQILSEKAGKDGNYYQDGKYVRMAGNTAWNGVLIALDGVLDVRKNLKSRQRPDIKDYQAAMSQKDSKMTRPLHVAYETLHLVLGYDGNLRYKIVQDGLEQAKFMIDWAKKNYQDKNN
ncbi:MAG: DUF5618 family protein [Dysgonamonadaceae bacterium]|jgi:hypothetical protein|nr:DUF5618 family protein [Dysgonamonadaceae bacterium]